MSDNRAASAPFASVRRAAAPLVVPIACGYLWLSAVVATSPDGSGGSAVHSCAADDPPEKWTVSWNAPFLTGNGYGSEAIAAAVGLNATLSPSRWNVAVSQHGDVISERFAYSLDEELLRFLSDAMKRQYSLVRGERQIHSQSADGDDDDGGRSNPMIPERTVVVCHSEPGAWSVPRSLYETEPCPPLLEEGRYPESREWGYIVGRTMFETDRLPAGWSERLGRVDEVWVPTRHHRAIFERANVTNVRVVGQGIDANRWDPHTTKALDWDAIDPIGRRCSADDVKFLSVFKWEGRKGHDILLPAFWDAFPPLEDTDEDEESRAAETQEEAGKKRGACLIIVTSLYHADYEEVMSDMRKYWLESVGQEHNEEYPYEDYFKGMVLLSGLSENELLRLYKTADAFVLPSRGEGWGRPYMEAMAMGLPVVATNWSGPTAFVTEENGYLLPVDGLVDAKLDAFPDHRWANPDKSALKELLVHIRDHPEEGKMKGARARQHILDHWSHEKVAEDIAKELYRIVAMKGSGRSEGEVRKSIQRDWSGIR